MLLCALNKETYFTEIDEVKSNNNTSESISCNIGVAFAAVQDKIAKEAALRRKKGKPLTYKTQCCKLK